jgi:hypothetical protein
MNMSHNCYIVKKCLKKGRRTLRRRQPQQKNAQTQPAGSALPSARAGQQPASY